MTVEPTTMRTWPYTAVPWTLMTCEAPHCLSYAAVLYDVDERDIGVPVCLEHADVLLERFAAIDLGRVERLPALWETAPPKRRPHVDVETWDRTPELWYLEQGGHGDDARFDPDWDIPF